MIGTTGKLGVDYKGYRANYTISLYKISLKMPLRKVGSYSDETNKGLRIDTSQFNSSSDVLQAGNSKKRIIVSILVR